MSVPYLNGIGTIKGDAMGALDGKVAVITGGNSGIGLATAKRFVKEGAYVFITGRRQAELDEAVSLIGKNVTAVQGDVSKLDDLDRLYETVRKVKGRVDIVFANAGVVDPVSLAESTPETFDKHFNLNARGAYFTAQKALPLLTDKASIILSGSAAWQMGIRATVRIRQPKQLWSPSSGVGPLSWPVAAFERT
jgi:NAD(P)-dependent dehydrogenase (short-subunit alcohol dehydrogenase family)